MSDDRLARVCAILEREGLGVEASAAGAEGEIVALRAPVELRPELARLAPELRACGFRFVTIELAGVGP